MWQPGREAVSRARTPWTQALDHAGAIQMGHMRRFLEKHGFGQLEPAQELLARNTDGAGHQRVAQSRDGTFVLAYTPLGQPVTLRTAGRGWFTASWFDPRTAELRPAGVGGAQATPSFDPPGEQRRGNDWVLLLRFNRALGAR